MAQPRQPMIRAPAGGFREGLAAGITDSMIIAASAPPMRPAATTTTACVSTTLAGRSSRGSLTNCSCTPVRKYAWPERTCRCDWHYGSFRHRRCHDRSGRRVATCRTRCHQPDVHRSNDLSCNCSKPALVNCPAMEHLGFNDGAPGCDSAPVGAGDFPRRRVQWR